MANRYHTLIFLLLCLYLSLGKPAMAASCCGGGSSSSSLIIADHLQEFVLGTAWRFDVGQTNNAGKALMESNKNQDQTFTYSLDYRRLYNDRLQFNLNATVVEKKIERYGRKEHRAGLGDLGIGFFYEALTNYRYSQFAYRLFVGGKFTVPFGENNFSSRNMLRADIRGSGFYKVDLPIVFIHEAWRFTLAPILFPKQPHLDFSYAVVWEGSYRHSFSDTVDLSGTIQFNYLDDKQYKNSVLKSGQYWELSLAPSYKVTDSLSLSLNYADSTLVGKSRNSALYRSVSLGLVYADLL